MSFEAEAEAAFKDLFGDIATGDATGSAPAPEGDPTPETVTAQDAPKDGAPKSDGGKTGDPSYLARALRRINEEKRAIAAERKALEGAKKGASSLGDWTPAKILANPDAFIKDYVKVEPGMFYRGGMGRVLEGEVPEQYRKIDNDLRSKGEREVEMESLRAEIRALREERTAESQHKGVKEYVTDYFSTAEAHVKQGQKENPRAAALFARNQARATAELRRIVAEDASAKIAAGGVDAPMTPQQAIAALEAYLADLNPTTTPAPTDKAKQTLMATVAEPSAPRGQTMEDLVAEADRWLATQSKSF